MPIKGKSNTIADGMSWQSSRTNQPHGYPKELLKRVMKKTTFIGALSMLVPNKRLLKTINEASKKDPDFKEIIRQPKEPFEIRDGLLYRESRPWMSHREMRNKLLHDYHSTPSASHIGGTKTLNRMLPKYYWKNMRHTVQEYVKSCQTCQQIKARNHKP